MDALNSIELYYCALIQTAAGRQNLSLKCVKAKSTSLITGPIAVVQSASMESTPLIATYCSSFSHQSLSTSVIYLVIFFHSSLD